MNHEMLHCSSRDESFGQSSAQVKLSANDTLPSLPVGEAQQLLGVSNLQICIKISVPPHQGFDKFPVKSGMFWQLSETPEIRQSSKQPQLQGQESWGSKAPAAFPTAKLQLLRVRPAAVWVEKGVFIPQIGGKVLLLQQFSRVWQAGDQPALWQWGTAGVTAAATLNSWNDTNFTHATSSSRISSWALQPSN